MLSQAEQLGIRDQIMTLAIEESQVSMDAWFSYRACSKTEWGKKVVDDVNKVLFEHRPSEACRWSYERWLEKNFIKGCRDAYDNLFLGVIK